MASNENEKLSSADASESTLDTNTIEINVRTPKETKKISIAANASILELRTQIGSTFSTALERIVLIFAGKILKDGETLPDLKIIKGVTLHLVIKSDPSASSSASSARSGNSTPQTSANSAASSSSPFSSSQPSQQPPLISVNNNSSSSASPFAGLGGGGAAGGGGMADLLSNFMGGGGAAGGMGGANHFSEMQRNMQSELMRNPEMMSQLLDNPIVQQMMEQPELMSSMMEMNPQMRQLLENQPELRQVLRNPSTLRQMMEVARNPSMMQEMVRGYDRALSNLESLPGGMNHLQRIYRDVQEPLREATESMLGVGGTGSGQSDSTGGATTTTSSSTTATSGTTGAAGGGAANPFAALGRENNQPLPNPWSAGGGGANSGSANQQQQPSAAANQGAGMGGLGAAMSNPMMQSMMEQIMRDPQLMQNAMQSLPAMQNMFSGQNSSNTTTSAASGGGGAADQTNPLLMNMMMQQLGSGGLGGAGMPSGEQLRNMIGRLTTNPEVLRSMSNPRVMEALGQIQRSYAVLRQEAPELMSSLLSSAAPFGASNSASSATAGNPGSESGSPSATTTTTTTTSSDSNTNTNATANSSGGNMNQLVASMLSLMAAGSQSQASNQSQAGGQSQAAANPEQQYASELAQLEQMGFTDRQMNVRALQASFGNVSAAIEHLLQFRSMQ